MKLSLSKTVLIGLIIFLALFLRIYKISTNPPSLSWDEVSIGYNAYSILKTGRDEHGKFLPLDTFVAFGDYKPPAAIYFTVPFVALFGLNELSVRLPSALFGTATVVLTYFLILELFAKDKNRMKLALLGSLFLSISPWHVNLSRAGFEANIALFFVVLGILFLLKARSNARMWIYAFIPFVVTIYTFNSSRYFVPLFGLAFLLMNWKKLWPPRKELLIGILFALILLLPIIPHLLSKEARLRFTEVNIFSDSGPVLLSNQRIKAAGNTWWAKILNNRRIYYFQSYMKHYMDHFDPQYLFIKGDGNPKFSIQDVGQLYLIEAPFLIIGIVALFLEYPSVAVFLLSWLLLAIVPAAVARETPHALRTLNTMPTWYIFIAYGVVFLLGKLPGLLKKPCTVFLGALWVFSFVYYVHTYYMHYPTEYSGEWQYGYRDAYQITEREKNKYDSIVVSGSIGRPYAYALFYGKYDPDFFFRTKKDYFDAAGFYHVDAFGKYQFYEGGPLELKANILYVLPPEKVPVGAIEISKVHLLNGTQVYSIFHI